MPGLDFLYGALGAGDAITNLVAQRNFDAQQQKIAQAKQAQQDFENQLKATQTRAEAYKNLMEGQKAGGPAEDKAVPIETVDEQGQPITKYLPQSQVTGQAFKKYVAPKETPATLQESHALVDLSGKFIGNGVPDPHVPGGYLVGDMHYGPTEARLAPPQAAPEPPDVATKRKLDIQEAEARLTALQAGGASGVDPGAVQGLHGDSYLQTLNPAQAAKIKALSEGRLAFPTSRSMAQPLIQQLINQVAQYDPTFDAVNYNARQKTRENFTSGTQGQQVNALNTAIGHLADLSSAVDALGNTSLTPLNTVKNYLSRKAGQTATTNFQSIVGPVADELTKVWRGTGGSEKDIQDRLSALDPSGSPEQLHGAIAKIGQLLESKIEALQSQYHQGMGIADIQMLTPKSQQLLDALEQKASSRGASSSAGATVRVVRDPTTGQLTVVRGGG
jgi:hypothetical protein